MSTQDEPRYPHKIMLELRPALRKMNAKKRPADPQYLACQIQHLQQELEASKRYWIRRVHR